MTDHPLQDIEAWLVLLSNNSLPVLRQTKRLIEEMRTNVDRVDGRQLAKVVLQDPMMTVRVLAYIQPLHARTLQHDITTIASAIMMAGIEPFFHRFTDLITVEAMLKGEQPQALLGALQVIRRSQRAADYAQEWARWRHDVNIEEVRIAALLHDLAEILVWCFAPRLGLELKTTQESHPGKRTAAIQTEILGFPLIDLQLALCRIWHLPELLRQLIDDDNQDHPRKRNVSLAVRLARHSAHGWDDPALPDDYAEIGALLNLAPDAVKERLHVPAPAEPGATDQPQ